MTERMEARPWLAHTQHQYATMLLAQGKAEDQQKAHMLLDEAVKTAQELGMNGLIEKIEEIGGGDTGGGRLAANRDTARLEIGDSTISQSPISNL